VERAIAKDALFSVEIRRLMSVPGVNVFTAATFLAAIGEVSRFHSSRRLVGYLGLDPRVRQSGSGPATHGRISKQGSAPARYALVEAAWSVVRQPGPPARLLRAHPRPPRPPGRRGCCRPQARVLVLVLADA
jgi:transposase